MPTLGKICTCSSAKGPALPLVWNTHPQTSIDFLGISCCNKNPETKKVLKCSTPILGYPRLRLRRYTVPPTLPCPRRCCILR